MPEHVASARSGGLLRREIDPSAPLPFLFDPSVYHLE